MPSQFQMDCGQGSQLPEPVLEIEERVPVEVLEKIFEFLPVKDRKTVVQVNSLWRKAGEAPHLWTWVRLPEVDDQNSRARAIEMMSSERLARVDLISVFAEAASEDLLQAMIKHSGLKTIVLGELGGELPAGLDSQLVVEALTRVEVLVVFSPLPIHLLSHLLTEVSQGGTTLKKLALVSNNNLSEVPG